MRSGRADLVAVLVAVALGTWIASIVLYYIGYSQFGWVQRRWPQKQRLIEAALDIVRRHPWSSALMVRFAYGLRLPLPIACGAARMPFSLYLIATGISSVVWTIAFTYVGVAFGRAAIRVLHVIERLEVRLAILAIILLVVLYFVRRRRINAEREASKDTPEPLDAS